MSPSEAERIREQICDAIVVKEFYAPPRSSTRTAEHRGRWKLTNAEKETALKHRMILEELVLGS